MSADDWEEVDTIKDAEGVVAVITKKKVGPPRYAIGLFKEFLPSGSSTFKRTMWIDPERSEAMKRVIDLANEKIHEISLTGLANATRPTPPQTNNNRRRVKV